MAQAHVVYTGVADGVALNGSLFQGTKFWLSATVPQKAHLSERITNNGGELVEEGDADIKIADHARKHPPPGTYGITLLTMPPACHSLQHGRLEELEDHRAGPPAGTIRNVGSAKPIKGTRTPFTREDDEILLKWVKDCESRGARISGNEIYQQLETINRRHTFQSWRDRYLKHLINRPKPRSHRADSSPNSSNRTRQAQRPVQQPDTEPVVRPVFTEDERDFLLEHIEDILNADEDNLDEMWAKVGEAYPNHTKEEWRNYYEEEVLPAYRRAGAAQTGLSSAGDKGSPRSRRGLTGGNAAQSAHQSSAVQRHSRSPIAKSSSPHAPRTARKLARSPFSKSTSPVTPHTTLKVARNGSTELQRQSHQRQASQRRATPSSPLDTRAEEFATPRPSKRKLTELHTSAISEDITVNTAERRRMMTGVHVTKEVPATPEMQSRSLADQIPGSQTLTEPYMPLRKKQRVVEVEETQRVDVVIPEPADESEDDVDDEVAEPGSESESEAEPSSPSTPRPTKVPAVEDTRVRTEDPKQDQSVIELDQWIDRHVEAGYSEDRVLFALKRTSMDATLAKVVLESLANGEGLPNDIQGIWSEAEDEVLQRQNRKLLEGLARKHGREAFAARLRFLKSYEDAAVADVD
ncbi:MAG: hypothetical protein M1816_004504 [Peltula sp. TS41687]|nr:MAG: hypothetical protein M1816_004504 [Peltula sp. TS41687]